MTIITNNYNDINNLIRMAYDFYYNQNKTLCYNVKPVNIKDVEDFMSIKRIYNVNQTNSFINSFLNDKLVFVKKILTIYGNKFIFKKINDPYSVNLSINVYTDTDEQNNLSNPQNINKVFLKLFSDFLSYEQTKHIMLQILNVDVGLIDMEEFFVNSNIPELKQFVESQNIVNKVVSIGITEHFFKLMYLNDYLTVKTCTKWTNEHYKALIFQVLHTLCVIHNKYPNFRHNGLIIKNIEGYLKTVNKSMDKYTLNGINYEIPNIGFIYKMNNFESSIIVDLIVNDQLDEDMRTINKTYDIKIFIKSLKSHFESIGLKLPSETQKYLDKSITYETTSALLLDGYFDSLKIIQGKKNEIMGTNKNNKQDIIENKKSDNNLSQDMPSQSFLFRGTRSLNNDSNINTSITGTRKNNDNIITGTRKNKSEKIINIDTRHSKQEDNLNSEDIESILGIEKSNKNGISTNTHKSKIASALKSTNAEIMEGNRQFSFNLPNQNNSKVVMDAEGVQMGMQGMMPYSGLDTYQPTNMPPNMISPNIMSNMMPNMQGISMPPNMMSPNMMSPNMMPPNIMPNMMPPNMMPPNMMPNMMPPNMMPPNMMSPNMMSNMMPNMDQNMMPNMDQNMMAMYGSHQPQQMGLSTNDQQMYENWLKSNAYNGQQFGGNSDELDVDTEVFFFRQNQTRA